MTLLHSSRIRENKHYDGLENDSPVLDVAIPQKLPSAKVVEAHLIIAATLKITFV